MAVLEYARSLSKSRTERFLKLIFSIKNYFILCGILVLVASNIYLFWIKNKRQLWVILSMNFLNSFMLLVILRYLKVAIPKLHALTMRRYRLMGSLFRTVDLPSDCPICLEPMKGFVFQTQCGHSFHPECIQKVSETSCKCPLCRANLHETVRYSIKEFIEDQTNVITT